MHKAYTGAPKQADHIRANQPPKPSVRPVFITPVEPREELGVTPPSPSAPAVFVTPVPSTDSPSASSPGEKPSTGE